jgi:hypothetical protein
MDSQPFRFLDLPPEIRLMIYERLPRKVKHHRLQIDTPSYLRKEQSLTFTTRTIQVSILRVNRLIYSEARGNFSQIAEDHILKETPEVLDAGQVSVARQSICTICDHFLTKDTSYHAILRYKYLPPYTCTYAKAC